MQVFSKTSTRDVRTMIWIICGLLVGLRKHVACSNAMYARPRHRKHIFFFGWHAINMTCVLGITIQRSPPKHTHTFSIYFLQMNFEFLNYISVSIYLFVYLYTFVRMCEFDWLPPSTLAFLEPSNIISYLYSLFYYIGSLSGAVFA